jgi:hypothetical protein
MTRVGQWAGITALTLCLAASACGTTSAITGSGRIVSQPVAVTSFSRLEVARAFDVRVSVGSSEQATVHVDDNLVDKLDVRVSDNTLHLDLKPGVSVTNATLRADVTVRQLAGMNGSGASKILLLDEIAGRTLSITLSGASRLDGRIKTANGRIDLSGSSRAKLSGSATRVRVTESGASDLHAQDLTVGSLSIDLSGTSTANVSAIDAISAGLSGDSLLRYRGSPRFTRNDVSGASAVTQLKRSR